MADIAEHPLFEAYPSLRSRVPRVSLGSFPTEVERLPALEKKLGLGSLWIKRDDRSGRLHGGNKVRKLEYLLAGLAPNADHGITAYGPISSNWTLACAVYARSLGIPINLLLFRMKHARVEESVISIQQKLAEKMEILSSPVSLLPKLILPSVAELLRGGMGLMPPGGTSPTSILGYVNAFLELAHQVEEGLLPMPDVIVLPYGTGGTAAGLAVGVMLSGKQCRVLGVRVASSFFSNIWVGRVLSNAALRIIRGGENRFRSPNATGDILEVESGFYGRGYGQSTRVGSEAARIVESEEGIVLDSTYTAKAMSCLIERARQGWGRDKDILFWHTFNSIPLEKVKAAFFP
ncbi:MAG: 1-aminocyclopropane-1-carboxylate deaminase/D-cysteine desulfhydrase [Candidatus Glassbacteria bacterium]